MKLTRWNKKPRGQVLLMTAFLIFVLYTLALTFFKLVPTELNSALRTKQALTAQVMADSGIKEAKVWLESQPPQKIIDQAVLDAEFNAAATGNPVLMGNTWDTGASSTEQEGRWRYDVQLVKNETGPFAFDAISTCYFENEPLRQTRATLARESFSRYALFIDQWRDLLAMEAAPGAIQGPFHTNDYFRIVVPSGFYGNGGEPFVSGVNGVMTHAGSTTDGTLPFVSSSGDGNAYFSTASPTANSAASVVPYDVNGALDSRYGELVNGGRSNMRATDHVVLPYSADELLVASLGGDDAATTAIPSDIGLYIPTGGSNDVVGGIFVVGDVQIDLSLDGDGNQVHSFTQAIPQEAYRFITQEPYDHPIYGNVTRTLGVGSSYYQSSTVTQSVAVQQIVGYETQTVTSTRQVQSGQQWVPAGGGGGTTVGSWQPTYTTEVVTGEQQVPIYDTVYEDRSNTVRNQVTITDPNDPLIGSTVDSYEIVGYDPRTRDVVNVIDADTYEADPAAYPTATRFFTPGVPKTATVTEVAGPSPKTRVVDYEGQALEYDGALNGVTFVDGNVKSLKGISKGAQDPAFSDGTVFQGRYITANPAVSTKGSITITDDLLQFYNGDNTDLRGNVPNTLKVGELSPNSQHALGLVARDTQLKPAKNDVLNLYSVILSGHSVKGTENPAGIPDVAGGFGSDPSIMAGSYGFNTFNLFGGLIQANQREWHIGGNGLSGNLTYDPAVAGDMPRFPRSNRVMTLRYADRYVDEQSSI